MFELLEIELTRVRKMAEQAGDTFLTYLIDLAIIEANAKARANDSVATTPIARPIRNDVEGHRGAARQFSVIQ